MRFLSSPKRLTFKDSRKLLIEKTEAALKRLKADYPELKCVDLIAHIRRLEYKLHRLNIAEARNAS